MSTDTAPGSLIVSPSQLASLATPKLEVYNPSLSSEEVQAFGRYYHAPAKGVFIVENLLRHPRQKAQGGKVVTVMDEYEPEPGGAAMQVVQQLLERYQHKGFIILMKDGLDEARKEEADARYIGWRLDYAQAIEAGWITKVAAFTAAQPGAPPPRQPRLIRAELGFLQRYRSGRLDRKEFICAVCSSEFDRLEGADGYDEHRRVAHPGLAQDVAPVRNPGTAPASEAVGVPGSPDDPGDSRGLVGAELLQKAKALKVDLLKVELMGLLEDDAAVIEQVIHKLAEAKAKQADQAKKA